MFPFPSRSPREQVRGTRFQTQRNTLPISMAIRLPETKRTWRCQRKPHDIAEDRPILMPSNLGARSIFCDENLLQLRQVETGSGLHISANFAKKWRDRICRQSFVFTEIVAPAERHNPPFPFEPVELEFLEGKRCDVSQ